MRRNRLVREIGEHGPAFAVGSLAGFWVGVLALFVAIVWPEGLGLVAAGLALVAALAWTAGSR